VDIHSIQGRYILRIRSIATDPHDSRRDEAGRALIVLLDQPWNSWHSVEARRNFFLNEWELRTVFQFGSEVKKSVEQMHQAVLVEGLTALEKRVLLCLFNITKEEGPRASVARHAYFLFELPEWAPSDAARFAEALASITQADLHNAGIETTIDGWIPLQRRPQR